MISTTDTGQEFTLEGAIYVVIGRTRHPRKSAGNRPESDTYWCRKVDAETRQAIGGMVQLPGATIRRAIERDNQTRCASCRGRGWIPVDYPGGSTGRAACPDCSPAKKGQAQ